MRYKECDRLAVLQKELSKVGGNIVELDDGLMIRGVKTVQGAQINPHDDHRIAMALACCHLRLRDHH